MKDRERFLTSVPTQPRNEAIPRAKKREVAPTLRFPRVARFFSGTSSSDALFSSSSPEMSSTFRGSPARGSAGCFCCSSSSLPVNGKSKAPLPVAGVASAFLAPPAAAAARASAAAFVVRTIRRAV